MKRILLVSLVGALLSTNLFGQNFAQFRAAYKAKKGNAELVRIFKAMTNANDKHSARTLVKNIDTLAAQADTAATQAKVEQAAAPMAPRPPSDEGLFEQQGEMAGFENVPLINPVVVAPVAPAAARPAAQRPLPPTPARPSVVPVAPRPAAPAAARPAAQRPLPPTPARPPVAPRPAAPAVPASEVKASQEEMSVAATALINILQSGALSSQDMNAALKTFTQNFPQATNIVKEAQALIDKKRTEEQAGKADAEVKTSVAAFLALNAYDPLNKKIEEATENGMKFSQAQVQEVTKHINSLATLSAAEKLTLITSLEPLL